MSIIGTVAVALQSALGAALDAIGRRTGARLDIYRLGSSEGLSRFQTARTRPDSALVANSLGRSLSASSARHITHRSPSSL